MGVYVSGCGERRRKGRTGDHDTGHVFVAAGDDDHAVKVVAAGSGLDLVCNEVAGLERVRHAAGAHADAVADADGAKLVAYDVGGGERGFYFLAETEEVLVASGAG